MAFAITSPASANIADTQASISVSWSGATTGTKWYVFLYLKINGVNVATYSGLATATGTQALVIAANVQAIYNAAKGSSLSGAVSIVAENYYEDDMAPIVYSYSRTGGTLTINYRITNLTLTKPVSGNQWNMDLVSGNTLTSSWSRTNAAFFARLKGYVWNGSSWVLVFNRYGWTTSSNIDVVAYGYKDAIVAAMNGVSPRNFLLQIITQFDDGTADYQDLSYSASETTGNYTQRTVSNGVIKSFVTLSTIAINNFTLSEALITVPFTLTTYGSYSHAVKLYMRVGSTDTLIRSESVPVGTTSGNFDIGATERSIILNALPNATTATIWAEVTTESYGSANSQNVSTTVTLIDAYKPTIGVVTWNEAMAYVETALGYTTGTPFFLTSKSRVVFSVPVTNALGATTTSIRVQFAGTDKSSAASPITTDFLISAGSLIAFITVTDSRGRSSILNTTLIVVRAYTYPVINKFEVFRSDVVAGPYAPLGTFLRCIIKGTASSVKTLDGTTEKNWVKYKIDYRVKATGSFSNNTAVAPGGLAFGELTINGIAGFLVANAYDVRIRVFDAFYDLDNDASTLEDTDDFAESLTILPFGEVSMMLGKKKMSIGKVWAQGTLDIAEDASGISINADGDIYSCGSKLPSFDLVYPIGSIYLSVLSTNPSIFFGGTWVALPDRFLVGAGTTFGAGSAAGTMSHVHSTTDHLHTLNAGYAMFNMYTGYNYMRRIATPQYYDTHKTSGTYSTSNTTNSFGIQLGGSTDGADRALTTSDVSHLPPYLSVFMWKRTA